MESGLSDDKQCQVEITRRGGEASIPPLALIFFGRLKFFFVLNKFQLKMLHCFVQAVVASYRIEKMYAYAFTLIKKKTKEVEDNFESLFRSEWIRNTFWTGCLHLIVE